MREILFRGKRVDNGEWIEGVYYKQTLFYGEPCEKHYIITSTESLGNDFSLEYSEVDPYTIGQFIGLLNKNGKKIFEGDILAYCDINGNEHIEGVVKYGKFNCSCCDGVYGWYIDDGDIRIIDKDGLKWLDPYVKGNIHDNPELLKEGAEE